MTSEGLYDELHTVPQKLELSFLDSETVFNKLEYSEKLYAYCMWKASWAGANIVAKQTSKESPKLMALFLKMFKEVNVFSVDKSDPNMIHFLNYVAFVMGENGNYASHGDTKMIPRMTKEEMRHLMTEYFEKFVDEYSELEDKIFSLNESEKLLGHFPDNTTTYFSKNMNEEDATIVNDYMTHRKIEGWNTCAKKYSDEAKITDWMKAHKCDMTTVPSSLYLIKIASVKSPIDYTHYVEKHRDNYFAFEHGNFSEELKNVKKWIKIAHHIKSLNTNQEQMLQYYYRHFKYGDINDHKKSQIYWVADKMPSVETNIGFIENYRDPSGIRSEFQSFVAMVDKVKTKKFKKLVDDAPKFLEFLPWPKEYEKDEFKSPDFTSLDVLTFVSSGLPAGINIPNYDEVRENNGFKNVSLDNVISSNYVTTDLPKYLSEKDGIIYNKYAKQSFAIDVAGHELLGHGSGKLFMENEDGTFNFDKKTLNPITDLPVSSWYKCGETWSYKFNKISSAYEECRAECVGLLLSNYKDIHDIFEHSEDEWDDICYVSWLWMIRTGLLSTLAYSPEKKQWSQAHSQARYAIYRVMLEAGIVTVEKTEHSFVIHVNRDKITTHGIPALRLFLMKLNVYKSIADVENGSKMFLEYSKVSDDDLIWRSIYIKEKKPRTMFIQPTLKLILEDGVVRILYKKYDVSPEHLIQSVVDKMYNNSL